MSESNKKTSIIINPYVFLVLTYLLISLAVTFYLIHYKNTTGNSFIDNMKKTNLKIEKTPLNEKYAFNNIKIQTWTSPIRDDLEYSEWNNSISYIEISGLKNTNVQEKINSQIKSKVQSLYNKDEAENPFYTDINIRCTVNANFSNILSISINKFIDYNEDNYDYRNHYTYETLNFRLDTGELIKFDDLFTSDASIKRILSENAYRSLGFSIGSELLYEKEDVNFDLQNVDYSVVENMVYNLVNDYNNGKEIEFCISYQSINVIYKNFWIDINLYDYYEYINLYRIVSNTLDLYEKGNLEAKDYVFGYPFISSLAYSDKISEKVYLMIAGSYNKYEYEQEYIEYKETVEKCLDKIINEIELNENKESDYNNNSKLYYLDYVYEDEENGSLSFNGYKVIFDSEEFDNKSLEEFLAKASRNLPSEMATINFYKLVDVYNIYGIYYYENNPYENEDFMEIKLLDYDEET